MKKMLLISILFLLITSLLTANAVNPILTWYSNVNEISSFSTTSVEFEYNNKSLMPTTDMEDYFDYAIPKWESNINLDIVEAPSASMELGTMSRYLANVWGLPDNTLGVAIRKPKTYVTTYTDLIGSYDFYEHQDVMGSQAWLIWDNDGVYGNQTSHFPVELWRYIALHELGHLIGYAGHSSISSHLMYDAVDSGASSWLTEPASEDVNHMLNVYSPS